MPFTTVISQTGSFATTITQGEATFTLDQVSAPATFTASIAALGPKGDPGEAATIEVGTVTQVGPDDPATVTNSGTSSAAVFNFEIPQGEQGLQGLQGIQGIPGDAATVAVGTVTTLDPGEPATVTNAGTSSAAIFNFGIPQGETGATGATGPQGPAGVVAASAPITYNAGTQTVGFDTTWNPFDQALNTTDQVQFASAQVAGPSGSSRGLFYQGIYAVNSGASSGVILSETGVNVLGSADLRFPDSSIQTTAYLGGDLKAANNLSDLADASLARGNLGLGTMATETAANYPTLAGANSFTGTQVVSVNTSGTAFRITQEGTGEAFRVEDSANPDSSPFVIDASGQVGIGSSPFSGAALNVFGTLRNHGQMNQFASTNSVSSSLTVTQLSQGLSALFTNTATATADCVRITNLGSGNSFVVEDSTNPDSTPFVVDSQGRVGIGTGATGNALTVGGSVYFGHGSAGGAGAFLSFVNSSGLAVSNGATNTTPVLTLTNLGTGASFRVNDEASDTTPFIVDAGGNVGVKTSAPGTDFEVAGNAKFTSAEITAAPAAGDNSTKVPTTAWVQAEVPAASTTVAGKVELATEAEVVLGSASSLAVTPYALRRSLMAGGYYSQIGYYNVSTSGTGATSTLGYEYGVSIQAPNVGVTGFAARIAGPGTQMPISRGGTVSRIDWQKPVILSGSLVQTANFDAGTVFRFSIGKPPTGFTIGDLTVRGFGISYQGQYGEIYLDAHNGTTLNRVATGVFASNTVKDFILYLDGAGVVTLYIDDSLIATNSGGPTGAGAFYNSAIIAEVQNTITPTVGGARVSLGPLNAYFGR